MSQADYAAVLTRTADLVRNWRPAAQAQSFLWRDVIDETSLDIRLYNAETALERLRGNVDLNASLAEAFGLTRPSDAPKIAALTEHQQRGVDDRCLSTGSPPTTGRHSARLAPIWRPRSGPSSPPRRRCKTRSALIGDDSSSAEALPPAPAPVTVSPSPIDLTGLTVDMLREAADRFDAQATMLTDRTTALSGVATGWGLPEIATFRTATGSSR